MKNDITKNYDTIMSNIVLHSKISLMQIQGGREVERRHKSH